MGRGSAFRETQTPDLTLRAVQRDLKDTLDQFEDHRRGMLVSSVLAATRAQDLSEQLVVVYTGPGANVLRLPRASLRGQGRGQVLLVANAGGAAITLAPSGRDTLNGSGALAKNGVVTLFSDGGTAWHIVSGPNAGAGAGVLGLAASFLQTVTLDAQGRVTGATAANVVTGDLDCRRHLSTQGTVTVAGDYVLSAGWGATASVAVATGSRDSRGRITVTANGAGLAANPTITFTFKNGAYGAAPFAIVKRNGGTGATTEPTWATATTTLTMTWPGTPVAGLTYIFEYLVAG